MNPRAVLRLLGTFPALGPQHVLAAAPGPNCGPRRPRRPNLTFKKLPFGKLHIWEVATWNKIVTWEVTIGKMPLGKHCPNSPKIFLSLVPIPALHLQG